MSAAADRDHLLLAARERAGQLPPPLAQDREQPRTRARASAGGPAAPRRGSSPISRFSSTDMRVNSRRPSGTSAMPVPADQMRRHGGQVDARRGVAPPRARACRPAIALTSVLLPAPFGPMTATTSPAPTSSVASHTADGVAVGDRQVPDLKQHGSCPGRPRRRARIAHDLAAGGRRRSPRPRSAPPRGRTARAPRASGARRRGWSRRAPRICRIRPMALAISAGLRPDSTSSSRMTRGRAGQRAGQLQELALVQVQLAGQRAWPVGRGR